MKQLPLWPEEVLAVLGVKPQVERLASPSNGTQEGGNQTQPKGQLAYIQLPLLGCQLEVEAVPADFK